MVGSPNGWGGENFRGAFIFLVRPDGGAGLAAHFTWNQLAIRKTRTHSFPRGAPAGKKKKNIVPFDTALQKKKRLAPSRKAPKIVTTVPTRRLGRGLAPKKKANLKKTQFA